MTENNFWNEKRITVTGGSGFLGSFVIDRLKARGVSAEQIFIPRSKDYDLVQSSEITRMLADSQPDIILHVAALAGGIGVNRRRPAEFFYNNLMMGVPLMHQAWEQGVEKFVALGTICSYPNITPVPFKEETLWDGYPEVTNAPYGLAKKMMLVQAQAYREQYDFNAIYLLPVNLYGPRDNFHPTDSHVIPDLIRKFIAAKTNGEKEVGLWGDGAPTREFLYVEDAAEGIVLAAENYDGSEPVNLGSGMEISIKDLATTIANFVGFEGEIAWDTSKPNGQMRRMLDVSRADEYFGFKAQTDFETGLRNTIEWYQQQEQIAA
jgi:GDP-L-fucose synthase